MDKEVSNLQKGKGIGMRRVGFKALKRKGQRPGLCGRGQD